MPDAPAPVSPTPLPVASGQGDGPGSGGPDLRPLKARLMDSPALAAFIEARDAAPSDTQGEGAVAQRQGGAQPERPSQGEEAGSTPARAATPDPIGDDVVARVRAKQAAKAQQVPSNETAPQQGRAGQPNAHGDAAPSSEPTYTAAQLQELLGSDDALDWLFDRGVDVVKLHERMVARANTPKEVRAVNDAVQRLEQKLTERFDKLEQAQQQQHVSDEQATFEAAVAEMTSFVGSKSADFPFLAVETAEEQRARVVRAAGELIESGEATGTDADIEAIAKLAEDAARKHASRYPGVRPEAGQKPAVGAGHQGTASAEPATLSGSLGGETSGRPGVVPPFGTPEWRRHMMRKASALGL